MKVLAQNVAAPKCANSVSGCEKIKMLTEWVVTNASQFPKESLIVSSEVVESLGDCQDSLLIVQSLRRHSMLLLEVFRWDEIPTVIKPALTIAKRNNFTREIAYILNILGLAQIFNGENYAEALDNFYGSFKLRESENMDVSLTLINIGLVYYKLRDNWRAIEYFDLAERRSENSTNRSLIFINTGLAYCELGFDDKADYFIRRGLNTCTSNCDQNNIDGYFALGMLKYKMNHLMSSEFHLNRSLALSIRSGNSRFIVENCLFLARTYIATSRHLRAKKLLDRCESISQHFRYNELLLDTYRVQLELAKISGSTSIISEAYSKFLNMESSMHSRSLLQQFSAAEIRMSHDENLRYLKHLDQLHNLRIQSKSTQAIILKSIILLFILLLIASWSLLVQCRTRSSFNRRLMVLLSKRVRGNDDIRFNRITLPVNELTEKIGVISKNIPDLGLDAQESVKRILRQMDQLADSLKTFLGDRNSLTEK